jgi:tRNA threonylcarbamoyladenosine modification (KEOPS) complex Cgi121 subunit
MSNKINNYSFLINSKTNKKIYINNIYGSISINNIENYLKSIVQAEKELNNQEYKIIIIPNTLIYSINHLLWSIFIAKNKIEDNINVSKDLFKEVLLTLSCSDQINKINTNYYLKENKEQDVFLEIVSENKINIEDIKKIKKILNIKEKDIDNIKYNKKEVLDYYNIKKEDKDLENKIIEKMIFLV